MSRLDGIDVSHHQGTIYWPKVAAVRTRTASGDLQPLRLVGMKATQGANYVDPTFARNRAGAAFARYRLLYHWLTPGSLVSIPKQVDHFLRQLGQLHTGEGVMLDVEQPGCTVGDALAFAQDVEHTTKRPVAVYTGAFFAGGAMWDSQSLHSGGRARVLAAYTSEQNARAYAAPFTWDVWQYTNKAAVEGVPTPVDGNQLDDPAALDLVCGLVRPQPWPTFDPAHAKWGLWPIGKKPPVAPGSTGDVVRYLQGVIFHKAGGSIKIDGNYGPATQLRVEDLHRVFKIDELYVGPRTWAAIDYLAGRP